MRSAMPIGIFGCGGMGTDMALYLADQGFSIHVFSHSRASLERSEQRLLEKANSYAAITGKDHANELLLRISLSEQLEHLSPCRFIMESIPEDEQLKVAWFQRIQTQFGAQHVLLSNTSSIDLESMAVALEHPENLFGLNWWNPALYLPLIELIKTSHCKAVICHELQEFLKQTGKETIVVNQPIPGYIGNRLQFALLREAVQLYNEGIASIEDIDRAVKHGFGLRLSLYGPFEVAMLGGSKDFGTISNNLFAQLSNAASLNQPAADLFAKDKIYPTTVKEQQLKERDELLHRLVKHLSEAPMEARS